MSNDFFNNTSPLSRNSKARSAEMRAKFDAIAAGFDKLPDKNALEQNAVHYAVATGSANTYAAAMPATLTAYAAGQSFRLQIPATNTGASTLNVDSLGARAIKRLDGTDVEAGDLTSGDIVELIFNGTAMVLMGFYRSHMAGIAANLGADLVFSGNPAFTGAPRFNEATNKSTLRSDIGLGSIATQAADSVNIDGGSIDGATIGQSDPAPAAVTTLTANSYGEFGSTVSVDSTTDGSRYLVKRSGNIVAEMGVRSYDTDGFDIRVPDSAGTGNIVGMSWDWSGGVHYLSLGPGGSEKMRVDGNGDVGIGTGSPIERLDVRNGSIAIAPNSSSSWATAIDGVSIISSVSTDNNAVPLLAMHSDRTDRYASISCVRGTASGYIGMSFNVSGNAAPAEAMRISPTGNLGLGVTTVEAKVHALEDSGTLPGVRVDVTNASYGNNMLSLNMHRAANSTADFLQAYSSNFADSEFRLRADGNGTCDGSWTGGGADYAEYFEWALAHLDWLKEWKRQRKTAAGISVVLDTVEAEEVLSSTELRAKVEARVGGDQAAVDAVLARIATGKVHSYLYMFCDESGKARLPGFKLRPATWLDDPEDIIGVISANPSVVGDGDIDRWKGKYLRDAFGAYIREDYEALSWSEVVTETETVHEQASQAQERTREVIEVVDGVAVKTVVTETVQVPLFDEFPLVDENGDPVMRQVQIGMTDPVLDEDGSEVEPAQPIYESQQVIHQEPRMVEVQRQTTREIEHSYAADEVPDGVAVPADAERVTQQRRKLNPEYDPSQEYTPRADRPEWDTVGLMGKLRVLKGQPVGARWIKMRDVSDEVEEWLVR